MRTRTNLIAVPTSLVVDVKGSVRVATAAALAANTRTGNVLTASANASINTAGIDGITTLAVNDRILIKNEATGANNGIYIITSLGAAGAPWIFTRAEDFNETAEVTTGAFCFIEQGTANANTGWVLTTANPITLNTTALTFTQFTILGTIGSITAPAATDLVLTAGSGNQNISLITTGTGVVRATFPSGPKIELVQNTATISQITLYGANASFFGFLRCGDNGVFEMGSQFSIIKIGGGSASSTTTFHTNGGTNALILGTGQEMFHTGATEVHNGSATGTVTSNTRLIKKVTAIANAAATAVLTTTIPNAAHSATLRVRLAGSLGAGGAIGANEATGGISYDFAITRTAGVAAVTTIATATGSSTAIVAGAATITITAAASAMSGAVGATNTFTVDVTISRGSGASTNHTCLVVAEILNSNATGITIA